MTHWGQVTHICVSKVYDIASDNGLSPVRRQAIIWTNAAILSIKPWGTYFSDMLSKIRNFSHSRKWTCKFRLRHCGHAVSASMFWSQASGMVDHTIPLQPFRKVKSGHSCNLQGQNKVNSSPHGQNCHHFADDIFRCIFVNEKFCILIKIHWSLFRRV